MMAVSPKHFQVPSAFTLPPYSSFSFKIHTSPLSVIASTIRVSTKLISIRVYFSRRSIVRYNDHAEEDEEDEEDEDKEEDWCFEEAVTLFNHRSYQLLGGYAAGQSIYSLETLVDFNNGMSETTAILFSPSSSSSQPSQVKLPTLNATDKHLLALTYDQRI